jgi:hypothetical protein
MGHQHVEMALSSDKARAFFFRAMLEGYLSATKPKKNTPFSGWNTLEYKEWPFSLVDMWNTTFYSSASSGVTTISYMGIPIWVMHYGGWYEDEAITTLKAALSQNYKHGVFIGGRGPMEFEEGDFHYKNQPEVGGLDFEHFEGCEYMDNTRTRTLVGYHWYRGDWLVRD